MVGGAAEWTLTAALSGISGTLGRGGGDLVGRICRCDRLEDCQRRPAAARANGLNALIWTVCKPARVVRVWS